MALARKRGKGAISEEAYNRKWHEEVDYEEYAMCSQNTQSLVNIYAQYVQQIQWDQRVRQLYPLLYRIVDWMEKTYR